MAWYITKLIFQIHTQGRKHAQFDEQWRVVHGSNLAEVIDKAEEIGRRESEEFDTAYGARVRWEFLAVTEAQEFDPMQDGATVFSRIEDQVQATDYIAFTQHRSETIRT